MEFWNFWNAWNEMEHLRLNGINGTGGTKWNFGTNGIFGTSGTKPNWLGSIARCRHFIEHFFTIPSHKIRRGCEKNVDLLQPFIRLASDG